LRRKARCSWARCVTSSDELDVSGRCSGDVAALSQCPTMDVLTPICFVSCNGFQESQRAHSPSHVCVGASRAHTGHTKRRYFLLNHICACTSVPNATNLNIIALWYTLNVFVFDYVCASISEIRLQRNIQHRKECDTRSSQNCLFN
jgi:hypothetical protein